MSDDIVTRLRKTCATSHLPDVPCTAFIDGGCVPCQAADEIEHLREENEQMKKFVELEKVNQLAWQAYERAVRK